MFQLHNIAKHPLSDNTSEISPELFESMWALFVAINEYWETISDVSIHRTQLLNFMINRIRLDPLYLGYYMTTANLLKELAEKFGTNAYQELFTNIAASTEIPPQTPIAIARQRVSNEFVSFHLAIGGFKSFGAVNYPGFVGGPNIPGGIPPYRTGEVQ